RARERGPEAGVRGPGDGPGDQHHRLEGQRRRDQPGGGRDQGAAREGPGADPECRVTPRRARQEGGPPMGVEGRGNLPGQLVVVSGPSGGGKSSVVRAALVRGALNARLSVSATTRSPRKGEQDGVDYFFLSEDEFQKRRKASELLELAPYNGKWYGTPATPVYETLATGQSVILEIEVQGARQVSSMAPSSLFVFIKAPTFKTLEQRLRGRGTETEEEIFYRLRKAREELAEAHWYDHVLINDDFERCVDDLIRLLRENGCGG